MGIGKCAGMAKAGARHSAADAALLGDAHDHMAAAGASCPAGADAAEEKPAAKDVPAGDLVKALADKTATIERLEKTANETTTEVKKLIDRMVKMESQVVPDPRITALRLVRKEDDDSKGADDMLEDLKKNNPEKYALAVMAAAQTVPRSFKDIGR
jgi:hypothetical protein